METRVITTVNNVAIVAGNDEKRLIPIKPICEALGIDEDAQRRKIKDDDFLSSTTVLSTAVANDGKEREMVCIPFEFIFGWLFTINPKNVKEESRETVSKYRIECYRALYQYFTEPQIFLQQKQVVMEEKINKYQDCQRRFKDAQKLMNEAKQELNQVTKITIDDWRNNDRQLSLAF